jgi:hypothetical protein
MNYNFFDYKGFIEGYHGQDYFGTTHLIFMVLATLSIVLICTLCRNLKKEKMDIYLKVLSIIIPILEKHINETVVKQNFTKLSNTNSWEIRKFVMLYAPIEIVLEKALSKDYLNEVLVMEEPRLLAQSIVSIITIICQRLQENVDTEIVKQNYLKLYKSNFCEIRKFVAKYAPIDLIVEMALIEKDFSVIYLLYHRLEKECKSEIVKQNYVKLIKVDFILIKIFVMKHAPIEIIEELLLSEGDIEILDKLKKFI